MKIPDGAYTALITPFNEDGIIDWKGLHKLIDFQVEQGISGIVPTGTTGESSTLTERQHRNVIAETLKRGDIFVLAGCGSNCTEEMLPYVEHVADHGGKAVLLVDPYYNGPSSLEIRREYYEPVARRFPQLAIIPYIIPGRTGCALLPEDLATLNKEFPNICGVKEATGDMARMRKTRALTSPDFQIFSGDDDKTLEMMVAYNNIMACGVISVTSNVAPFAIQKMCKWMLKQDGCEATAIVCKLQNLFGIVTVVANRNGMGIQDKFRNPLPTKTMMNILGMPSGPCRRPLGKMSVPGLIKVYDALKVVFDTWPEVLRPIEDFFKVDIAKRLADKSILESLLY